MVRKYGEAASPRARSPMQFDQLPVRVADNRRLPEGRRLEHRSREMVDHGQHGAEIRYRSSGPRSVTRADSQVPISWCGLRGWMSPCTPPSPKAHPGICPAKAHPSCGGRRLSRPSARQARFSRLRLLPQAGGQARGPQRQEPDLGGGAQNSASCDHTPRDLGDAALAMPNTRQQEVAA